MASLPDPYCNPRSRSIAWDHFVKRDTEKCLAECNYCQEILCYASTSANLKKHLERKHNFIKKDSSADKEKSLETEYWEYFNCDEDTQQATCKLCSEEVDYEESSNAPLDHLKSKHISEINEVKTVMVTEEDASDVDVSDEHSIEEKPDKLKTRRRSSRIWEYFEIVDDEKSLASCKLCGQIRSYRSTITNLVRHLNRKHANYESQIIITREQRDLAETDAEDNAEKESTQRKSTVWLYFKCVDSKSRKAQCLICKKIISHSTTVANLKQHLRRMHPHLKFDETKTVLLSAEGELFEVETDKNNDLNDEQHEPEEMDTVYLEDFETLENPLLNKQTKQKCTIPPSRGKKQKSRLPTINLHESSSDDEVPMQKSRKRRRFSDTSDSIDHFGKYAVALLRELPKEISNKLQSDFITRVMDAHLTYESQKLTHTQAQTEGPGNAYAITVTTVNDLQVQEPKENVVTQVVHSETQSQKLTHAQAQTEGPSNAYAITVTTVDDLQVQEREENVVTQVVHSETQSQECH